jgi:phospholipid/cholesterol/gamma-HCH transport system substrate-binding protein
MAEKLSIPRRFRNIRKQISMFLLTAFVGFVGVVTLVAYKQGMFVQHTHIYFNAPDATGINKGMSVRLYGVPVGSVQEVQLAERGGVRVRLGINSDYMPRIPRGSQARIVREGYVGAASIQIVTGTAGLDRTPLAQGEDIRFIAQKGMNEMLDEVRAQMTPAFEELRKFAADMSNPQGDFRKSVTATRELIEQLPEANRELRSLMRTTERTMAQIGKQAETIGAQASATLETFNRIGTHAERELPVIAGKLATTLDSLNSTAVQVRETTRANGEALREILTSAPEIVRGSNELVRDSQEIAQAARRTWFLRDYVEQPQMRTLPVDSFESFSKRVP